MRIMRDIILGSRFLQYDWKKAAAIIRLSKERIGDVIDWFGKDVAILHEGDNEYIHVRVTGSDNGIRMCALQYGRLVEVISPAELRKAIRQDVAAIAEKYNQ